MIAILSALLAGRVKSQVARALKVSPSLVRHWESGARQIGLRDLDALLDHVAADSQTRASARLAWEEQERTRTRPVGRRNGG